MSEWRAFAKLTLSLRVKGRRPDGFHELHALTVSASEPHDDLTITVGEVDTSSRVEITVAGPAAVDVTTGSDNLAARAAHALLLHAGRDAQMHIALHKQIPAGAGLGGGSADAAGVLVALDHLLALGTPIDELAAIGATLGSDVPFCVRGGAAHMRGRGERIEPTTVPSVHVLIAVPPFAISTPAVYRAWDELGGPESTRIVAGPAGLGPLRNDLEPAAEHVAPLFTHFRGQLEQATGTPAILAGSGSACAVLYETESEAVAARDRVLAQGFTRLCVVGATRPTGVEPVTSR